MNTTSSLETNSDEMSPHQLFRVLYEKRQLWIKITLACMVVAVAYAVLVPRKWEASQGMVVRREVNTSSSMSPGKFTDLYEMRTFQETILELARSRQVIVATLQAVNELATGKVSKEPTDQEINTFRRNLSMTPPGGAEFGKTEVFYLSVKDTNRERAIQCVAELCRQVDTRLRQLRDERSESLVIELQQQVDLANEAHQKRSQTLTAFESTVGADLSELRMLNASFSGQSDLRQQAIQLESESRQAKLQVRDSEELLKVLEKVQNDPQQLVAMPSSLLTSQPTLRQLKDGLVAAQLRLSRLLGTRTANHPHVLAAKDSVEKIRGDLRNELQVALQGVQVELVLSQNRADNLQQQAVELENRLSRLANLRAEYENHVSAAENSRVVLDQARKQLGEMQAAHAAAQSTSLVATIDAPETGPYPVGLSRSSMVLIGTFGGCFLGLGWIFVTSTNLETNTVSQEVHEFNRPAHDLELEDLHGKSIPTGVAARSRSTKESPSVSEKITQIVTSTRRSGTPDTSFGSLSSDGNGVMHVG